MTPEQDENLKEIFEAARLKLVRAERASKLNTINPDPNFKPIPSNWSNNQKETQ